VKPHESLFKKIAREWECLLEIKHERKAYSSDLTELEWGLIKDLVAEAKAGGRPEEYPKREIMNEIFYVDRSGCGWRMLPPEIATLGKRYPIIRLQF
jgi:hypothetical protein